ncbi:bifunctional diguanylate cyclase/phosphodiesterase [Cognatiluteimonas telluris]|uniref:bifunctional diguanylate cyclase/phosphodiesterase n=1 Tax=Cognatiluteimonas telluris TaxID=1104775 RepID=UPI001FAF4A26|nr:EAL domain-containing protein [Lysobacter telluris]
MGRIPHSAASPGKAPDDRHAPLPTPRSIPAWAWALLGLVLGLLASATGVLLERNHLRALDDERLSQLGHDSVALLQRQFEDSALLLRAVQSAYSVSDSISEPHFESMLRDLRPPTMLPSLVALAFARRQPGAPGHYRYERVAPVAGNASLLGFDAAAQPANMRALERARDRDEPVMSAPFTLRQPAARADDARGITLRLPVYTAGPAPETLGERRRRETGALALSMRVRPLLLAALPAEALQRFRIHALDVTGPVPLTLYESGGDPGDQARDFGGEVAFGGRRWHLRLSPLQDPSNAAVLWAVATGGLLASLLLAALAWSIADTRRRALRVGHQMSARYRESEEQFRTLNDVLPALVLMARAEDGRVMYANQVAQARLGERIGDGAAMADLFDDESLRQRLREFDGQVSWSNVDALLTTLNGDKFWASTSLARVRVRGVDTLLMVANDVSEQRQLTELLNYQATHDTLTELYNRREFERYVQRALFGIGRGATPCALLYIDLDQFKLINDTSGHLAGDQLLAQLALVMAEQLRAGDILARLGGDEFGVLAHDAQQEGAQALAERLRKRVDEYIYVWEQRSYTISASIGVVLLDQAGLTLSDVLAHADAACYIAKDRGRNRVHFFAAQDDETLRRRGEMEWANRLRWVIEENRLLLDYQEVQPLQDKHHGQGPDGPHVELLIRLRDEDGRVILPGAFLPAAERYGLMPLLDRWVVGQAISHFDQLHASGRAPGRCSLNLAASTLDDDGLAEYVLDLIESHGVAPSRLCFEITETEAVRNLARAVRFIERLRSVGCQVALDDFGAGMSSFGYLKNLPVDVIKIDGSFVRDLDTDPMSRSIINAITEIGHLRGLDVVAEWVASEACAQTLREIGVDYGQGFALHKPERVLFQRERET